MTGEEDGQEGVGMLEAMKIQFSEQGSLDVLEEYFNMQAMDLAVCSSIRRRLRQWVRVRCQTEASEEDQPLTVCILNEYGDHGLEGFDRAYSNPFQYIESFLMPAVGEMLHINFTVWGIQSENEQARGVEADHQILYSATSYVATEDGMELGEVASQLVGSQPHHQIHMISFHDHVDLLSRNFYVHHQSSRSSFRHTSRLGKIDIPAAKPRVGQATEIFVSSFVEGDRAGWSTVITESNPAEYNIVGEMTGELVLDKDDQRYVGSAGRDSSSAIFEALISTFGQVMHKVHDNLRVIMADADTLHSVVSACYHQGEGEVTPLVASMQRVFARFESKVTFVVAGPEKTWWSERGVALAKAAVKGKRYHEGAPGYIINPGLVSDDHDKHRKKKKKKDKGIRMERERTGEPRNVTDFALLTQLEGCPVQLDGDQTTCPHLEGLFDAIRRLHIDDPSVTLRWLLSLSELGLNKLQSKLSAVRKEMRREEVVAQMAARGDPYNLSCLMSSLHKEATACFGALPVDEHSTFSPVEFRTMLRQHLQISNPAVTANPPLLCACKKQMDNLNRLVSCCKCQNHLTINVHNEVQRVLAELASASKTQCTVKVRKMYEALNPGVNKEADLIMDGALAVDVRISAVGSKEITMRTAAQPDYTVLRGGTGKEIPIQRGQRPDHVSAGSIRGGQPGAYGPRG